MTRQKMKNLFVLNIIIPVLFLACSQRSGNTVADSTGSSDTGKAVLEFREYEHSFGKVEEGEKVAYVFNFINKGTGNLVIQSATTTCGCTVSKYNRKPVAPGREGTLEVVFDTSGRNGLQTKTVTVKSNATVPVVILKITAEVEPEK